MDEIDAALDGHDPLEDDDGCLEPEDCTEEELGVWDPMTEAERAQCVLAARQARERWRRLPDDPPPVELRVMPTTVGTVMRAARRHIQVNQRELAAASGMSRSTLGRLEAAEESDLRLSTLLRVLDACGLRLAVVDQEGTLLATPDDHERFRDRTARHLPAHLDVCAPHPDHRSRYRSRDFAGPARVTVGRPRPTHVRRVETD